MLHRLRYAPFSLFRPCGGHMRSSIKLMADTPGISRVQSFDVGRISHIFHCTVPLFKLTTK